MLLSPPRAPAGTGRDRPLAIIINGGGLAGRNAEASARIGVALLLPRTLLMLLRPGLAPGPHSSSTRRAVSEES